jgi:hypothetical protein
MIRGYLASLFPNAGCQVGAPMISIIDAYSQKLRTDDLICPYRMSAPTSSIQFKVDEVTQLKHGAMLNR